MFMIARLLNREESMKNWRININILEEKEW